MCSYNDDSQAAKVLYGPGFILSLTDTVLLNESNPDERILPD